jgi:hypothetical protein
MPVVEGKSVFIGYLVVIALASAAWFVRTWRSFSPGGGQSEIARLKKRYARLLGVPLSRAYDALERGLEERLRHNPARPVEDCLRDMIAELERDKQR